MNKKQTTLSLVLSLMLVAVAAPASLARHMKPTPKAGVVYQLETNSFKNSDGILNVRKSKKRGFKNSDGILNLRHKRLKRHNMYQYGTRSLKHKSGHARLKKQNSSYMLGWTY